MTDREVYEIREGDPAPIARWTAADPAHVLEVLAAPVGHDDGRSDFVWIWLRNGDLILGVFPRGGTFLTAIDSYEEVQRL